VCGRLGMSVEGGGKRSKLRLKRLRLHLPVTEGKEGVLEEQV
jgi:hypothetical protein